MKYINFAILLFILGSCNLHSNKVDAPNLETITIPADISGKKLMMSEIYDSLQYVPLETTDENLIGEVQKFIPLQDKYVIVDKVNAKAVYVFDHDGKFLNQIGQRGAGAGEYVKMSSAAVDEIGNRVFIYDSALKSLIIYDLRGEFKEKISLPLIAREIEYIGDNKIALFCNYESNPAVVKNSANPNLVIYDLKSKTSEGYLYTDTRINSTEVIIPSLALVKSADGIYTSLHYPLNEKIYKIDSTGIVNSYLVDFDKENKNYQEKYLQNLIAESVELSDENNTMPNFKDLTNCILMQNGIYIEYINYTSSDMGCGFYNMESGKYIGGESNETYPLQNDVDNGWIFSPMAVKGNIVYGVMDAAGLEILENTKSDQLNHMKETMSSESNPIIILAFTKNK